MPSSLRVAHWSDTHLGASAFAAVSPAGNNQREEDIVRTFYRVCGQIGESDTHLAIHSGDVFHQPRPQIEALLVARDGFRTTASRTPDGYIRQTVVSDGNHDEPREHQRPSALSLLDDIPGVHVVNSGYEQVTFDPDRDQCHPDLADVVVHAVPHVDLKHINFDTIQPVDGKMNILVCHGVAEGSELFRLNLTREYPIPAELLVRDWDYVALGHYHRQGPVVPGQFGLARGATSKIWYAGSSDTVTFSDFSDGRCDERGWLDVTVNQGELPDVTVRTYPVRAYVRLPKVDATGLDQEQLAAELRDNITADGNLDGAVVIQKIAGVTRDLWSTVDVRSIRTLADQAGCLHYETRVAFGAVIDGGEDGEDATRTGFGDLPAILEELAASIDDDDLRAEVLRITYDKLARHNVDVEPDGEDGDGDEPTGDEHDAVEEAA